MTCQQDSSDGGIVYNKTDVGSAMTRCCHHVHAFFYHVRFALQYTNTPVSRPLSRTTRVRGGSVAEWLACWTQVQKGPGSNRSSDAVG